MFHTYDEFKLAVPAAWTGPGEHVWRIVGHDLQFPWFHVTHRAYHEDGTEGRRTLFVSDVDQLLELSDETRSRLIEVRLVSPGWMNGSSGWNMELLTEIWVGSGPEQPGASEGYVYILANGTRYFEHPLDGPGDMIQLTNRVFCMPTHSANSTRGAD